MSDLTQSFLIGAPMVILGLFLLVRPGVIPILTPAGLAGRLFVRFVSRSLIGLGLFFLVAPVAYRTSARLTWVLYGAVLVVLVVMTVADLLITLIRPR